MDDIIKYITVFSSFIVVATTFASLLKWLRNKRKQRLKMSKDIEDKIRDNVSDCSDLLNPEIYKTFIDLKFQETNPDEENDLEEGLSPIRKSLIKYLIDEVFIEENKIDRKRRIFVLGGSGMGKTSFSVHLLCEYLRKYKYKGCSPFDIIRLYLEDQSVLETIEEKSKFIHPNNAILLLDALDENIDAYNNTSTFIQKLDKVTAAFKYVIITCRSQFFVNDAAIIRGGGVHHNGIDKRLIDYERFYISPISSNDVSNYLDHIYAIGSDKYARAKKLSDSYSTIVARPLLLTYIDSLISSSGELTSTRLVYERITNEWLKREACSFSNYDNCEDKERKLFELSKQVAVTIYESWKSRKIAAISPEDFICFQRQYGFDEGSIHFRDRSLLNRRGDGYIKFSHKSFFEYFLALAAFDDPRLSLDYSGLDFAFTIWEELIHDTPNQVISSYIDDDSIGLKSEISKLNGLISNDPADDFYGQLDKTYKKAINVLNVWTEYECALATTQVLVEKILNLTAFMGLIESLEHLFIQLNAIELQKFIPIKIPNVLLFECRKTLVPYSKTSAVFGPHYQINDAAQKANKILVRNIHSIIDCTKVIDYYSGHLIKFCLPHNTSIEDVATVCETAVNYISQEKVEINLSINHPLPHTFIIVSAILDGYNIEMVITNKHYTRREILNCLYGKLKVAHTLVSR